MGIRQKKNGKYADEILKSKLTDSPGTVAYSSCFYSLVHSPSIVGVMNK